MKFKKALSFFSIALLSSSTAFLYLAIIKTQSKKQIIDVDHSWVKWEIN